MTAPRARVAVVAAVPRDARREARHRGAACRLFALAVAALAALAPTAPSAQATFKVVRPDGSVVYTDRPPPASVGRSSVLRGGVATEAAAPGPDAGLPPALRALVQRQPVRLYTAVACTACDAAREWLRRRGVPFAEALVVGDEDVLALERTAGTRSVPVLTIGAQPLRGFAADDWAAYLDAAGYPPVSQLPRGWKAPAPRPLTAPAPAADASVVVPDLPRADVTPPRRPPPSPPPPPERGIRF